MQPSPPGLPSLSDRVPDVRRTFLSRPIRLPLRDAAAHLNSWISIFCDHFSLYIKNNFQPIHRIDFEVLFGFNNMATVHIKLNAS